MYFTTLYVFYFLFFFSSRRRHTRFDCDWSSDVCSSDLSSQFRFHADTLQDRNLSRARTQYAFPGALHWLIPDIIEERRLQCRRCQRALSMLNLQSLIESQ